MDLTETPQEQAACILGVSRIRVHRTPASKIAEFVIQNFDVRKLGENCAVLALCDIVVDVPFGKDDEGKEAQLRGRALGLLMEIVGTHVRHELTQEDAASIQRMVNIEGCTIEQVREHFRAQSQ